MPPKLVGAYEPILGRSGTGQDLRAPRMANRKSCGLFRGLGGGHPELVVQYARIGQPGDNISTAEWGPNPDQSGTGGC